jgi:hypothetical protein
MLDAWASGIMCNTYKTVKDSGIDHENAGVVFVRGNFILVIELT